MQKQKPTGKTLTNADHQVDTTQYWTCPTAKKTVKKNCSSKGPL